MQRKDRFRTKNLYKYFLEQCQLQKCRKRHRKDQISPRALVELEFLLPCFSDILNSRKWEGLNISGGGGEKYVGKNNRKIPRELSFSIFEICYSRISLGSGTTQIYPPPPTHTHTLLRP